MGWTSPPVLQAGSVTITAGTVEVENATGTVIATGTQQFALTSITPTAASLAGIDLNTATILSGTGSVAPFPNGTAIRNFSAVGLTVVSAAAAGESFTCYYQSPDGVVQTKKTVADPSTGNAVVSFFVPVIAAGNLFVQGPVGDTTWAVGITLYQDPITPAVLLAGIASDLPVIPVSLAADQSVNIDQIHGSTTVTAAAGVQRIGIAGATNAALDSSSAGVLDHNTRLVGNTTVSTGAGAVGAGSQRIAVAQDSTTVAGSASLPAGSNTIGAVNSAPISGLKTARAVAFTVAASTATVVVAAVAGKTITVYGFDGYVAPAAATAGAYSASLLSSSTSVPVGTGGAHLDQATAVGLAMGDGKIGALWIPPGIPLPIGEGLNITTAANAGTADVGVTVYYTQA